MNQSIVIQHQLADVVINPTTSVDRIQLAKMVCATLDQYSADSSIPADAVHDLARLRHQAYYRTPGHLLRQYRRRSDLTQTQLANLCGLRQHHLSEMENNKRSIGKTTARKLAEILECDYRVFL